MLSLKQKWKPNQHPTLNGENAFLNSLSGLYAVNWIVYLFGLLVINNNGFYCVLRNQVCERCGPEAQ